MITPAQRLAADTILAMQRTCLEIARANDLVIADDIDDVIASMRLIASPHPVEGLAHMVATP